MWALVILILCGMPSSGLPSIKIPGIDKIMHLGLFAVFATLLLTETNVLRVQQKVKRKHQWLSFLLASTYGGLIELMQQYVFTSRGADRFDFYADIVGAVIAVVIYPLINRTLKGYI